MKKYRIADLTIDLDARGATLRRKATPYRAPDDAKLDCELDPSSIIEALTPKMLRQAEMVEKNDLEAIRKALGVPEIDFNLEELGLTTTMDELEYVASSLKFSRLILEFGGIVLHASAIVYENAAYLFSASSRVGKSTHTRFWLELLGEKEAFVLNDDKPALRKIEGKWFAYGTPWSGNSDLNRPMRVPLQGIAFLERDKRNWIRRIGPAEATGLFLNQTLRPSNKADMTIVLNRAVELLEEVPVFRLGCLPNLEAARLAYEAMKTTRCDD